MSSFKRIYRNALCIVGLAAVFSGKAVAEATIDLHDPLRGITFYSVQLSTDSLPELQVGPGRFSPDDLMTMGISVLIFDETADPEEYVLWLRHDGPARWLVDVRISPIRIMGDDQVLAPMPLHMLRQQRGKDSGPFVEKLEFALTPEQFDALLASDSFSIQLATLLGAVEKTLTDAERDTLEQFRKDAITRHQESRTGLAAVSPSSK